MDCVTCKTAEDKLRWASTLYTKNTFGAIDVDGLQFVLRLTDEIEENGFLNGPSEEELEELLYRYHIISFSMQFFYHFVVLRFLGKSWIR